VSLVAKSTSHSTTCPRCAFHLTRLRSPHIIACITTNTKSPRNTPICSAPQCTPTTTCDTQLTHGVLYSRPGKVARGDPARVSRRSTLEGSSMKRVERPGSLRWREQRIPRGSAWTRRNTQVHPTYAHHHHRPSCPPHPLQPSRTPPPAPLIPSLLPLSLLPPLPSLALVPTLLDRVSSLCTSRPHHLQIAARTLHRPRLNFPALTAPLHTRPTHLVPALPPLPAFPPLLLDFASAPPLLPRCLLPTHPHSLLHFAHLAHLPHVVYHSYTPSVPPRPLHLPGLLLTVLSHLRQVDFHAWTLTLLGASSAPTGRPPPPWGAWAVHSGVMEYGVGASGVWSV